MKDQVKFYTIAEVKAHFGVTEIKILENPKTGKKFVSVDSDTNLKCEQAIDITKPMGFILGGDDAFDKRGNANMENACLINIKEGVGATTIATL